MQKRELYRVLCGFRSVVEACIKLLEDESAANQRVASEMGIQGFITQRLILSPDSTCSASAIRKDFVEWWVKSGHRGAIPSQRLLGSALRAAGFMKTKRGGRVVYVNAAIADTTVAENSAIASATFSTSGRSCEN